MALVMDDKARAGFHSVAGKGKELPKDGGKDQPGASRKANVKDAQAKAPKLKGDNNLQRAQAMNRRHVPEGHDANNYGVEALQTNSYNNRMDPNVLDGQRKMREDRRIQLKHAKDKVGVKTRLESAKQKTVADGFALGAGKIDRVSGMMVINPALRSTVPAKELAKRG